MSDRFTRHIIRQIIISVARMFDYGSISETALNVLVGSVIYNLQKAARTAAALTTHCGRIDTNGSDLFFALARSNVHVDDLVQFYREHGREFPQFEMIVDPYPVPCTTKTFPHPEIQGDNTPLSFRANMGPRPNLQSRHFPAFLPQTPPTIPPVTETQPTPSETAADNIKQEQQELQKMMPEILRTEDRNAASSVSLDLRLVQPGDLGTISVPTDLLASTTYKLEGERPIEDPECLPWIDLNNCAKSDTISRDTTYCIKTLETVH